MYSRAPGSLLLQDTYTPLVPVIVILLLILGVLSLHCLEILICVHSWWVFSTVYVMSPQSPRLHLFALPGCTKRLFRAIRTHPNVHFYRAATGLLNVNKNPASCNNMQVFIYCKVTLHVSGVTAPIIKSTKNCNRSIRYRL